MFVLTYIRVTIIKYKKNKSIMLHKLGALRVLIRRLVQT